MFAMRMYNLAQDGLKVFRQRKLSTGNHGIVFDSALDSVCMTWPVVSSHFSFVEQHYRLVFIIANAAWVTRQKAADYVATTAFETPNVPRDICSLSPAPTFRSHHRVE